MRGLVVDCRTGEVKEVDDGLPPPKGDKPVPELSINFEKLISVLIKKGIISSPDEVK